MGVRASHGDLNLTAIPDTDRRTVVIALAFGGDTGARVAHETFGTLVLGVTSLGELTVAVGQVAYIALVAE